MNTRTKKAAPAAICELLNRISEWRKARSKAGPMPEALWKEAAELGRMYGVSLVSRHLKLDFHGLRRRITERREKALAKESGFVELRCMGISGEPSVGNGYVTEMEIFKPGEVTVRVRQSGPMGLDIAGIITGCIGRS